jgi:hypothetical protein
VELELTPHVPVLAQLAFSLEAGFSIPLVAFALTTAHSLHTRKLVPTFALIAGVCVILTPSAAAVVAFFACALNFDHTSSALFVFLLVLPVKLFGLSFMLIPIWREYQVRGLFLSQFGALFDSIGIPYVSIFFLWLLRVDHLLLHRTLSALAPLALICFIRQGNDLRQNDIALTGIVLPVFFVLFVRCLTLLKEKVRSPVLIGVFHFAYWAIIVYIIVSGLAWLVKLVTTVEPGLNAKAVEFGKTIASFVPPTAVVMADRRFPNPVSIIAGRQVWYGRADDVWRRGERFAWQSRVYDTAVAWNRTADILSRYGIEYLVEYRPQPLILRNVTQWRDFDLVTANEDWILLRLDSEFLKENPWVA